MSRFPRFVATTSCSDACRPSRVVGSAAPVASLRHPSLGATAFRQRRQVLPGSCGVLACMLRSSTPVGPPRPWPFGTTPYSRRVRCCLPLIRRRRLPRLPTLEAQSRSLHARCLRFTARVALCRRARLAAGWWPPSRTGLEPAGLHREVSALFLYIASSSPRLAWRTESRAILRSRATCEAVLNLTGASATWYPRSANRALLSNSRAAGGAHAGEVLHSFARSEWA